MIGSFLGFSLIGFPLGSSVIGSSLGSAITDSFLRSSVLLLPSRYFLSNRALLFLIKNRCFVLYYILKKKFALNNYSLRYYATFKVRKFESLFYKIHTLLQKTTPCIRLQAEQILSVNI